MNDGILLPFFYWNNIIDVHIGRTDVLISLLLSICISILRSMCVFNSLIMLQAKLWIWPTCTICPCYKTDIISLPKKYNTKIACIKRKMIDRFNLHHIICVCSTSHPGLPFPFMSNCPHFHNKTHIDTNTLFFVTSSLEDGKRLLPG